MNCIQPLIPFSANPSAGYHSSEETYTLLPGEKNLHRIEKMEKITHLDLSQYGGISELPWPPNTIKLTIKECHFNFMEGWLNQENCPDSLEELCLLGSFFVPIEFQLHFQCITTCS